MDRDAVIFDMDGLLLDSERLSLACFRATLRGCGAEEDDALFLSLVGTNERAQQEALERGLGPQIDVARFWTDWKSLYAERTAAEGVPLKPGVLPLLEWLAARGVVRAVATSSETAHASTLLRRSGVLDAFETVVGGDQVTRSKPFPDIYLAAAEAVGADVARSVALEDSPNGVRAAHAAGLTVLQVPDLIEPTASLLALGHRVCADLVEVRRVLERGPWGDA